MSNTTPTVYKQPKRVRFERGKGIVLSENYRGRAADVEQYFNELIACDNPPNVAELVSNGAHAQISVETQHDGSDVTDPQSDVLATVWEVLPNEQEVPIECWSYFDDLDPDDEAYVQSLLGTNHTVPTNLNPIALDYYKCLINGVESILLAGLTLRCTTIVPGGSRLKNTYTNINKVVSVSSIGAPSALIGTLPADWEWMKKTPQVRQLSRYRFQLIKEWWGLEKWSKLLYDGTGYP